MCVAMAYGSRLKKSVIVEATKLVLETRAVLPSALSQPAVNAVTLIPRVVLTAPLFRLRMRPFAANWTRKMSNVMSWITATANQLFAQTIRNNRMDWIAQRFPEAIVLQGSAPLAIDNAKSKDKSMRTPFWEIVHNSEGHALSSVSQH
eukprot:Lithocolla_globosa_v1_NODE_1177_length_2808_cov_7.547766.p2 type:complete len:148 gc:universal NODE_1177_length_2808_cov_7.547766:1975-2418(+)